MIRKLRLDACMQIHFVATRKNKSKLYYSQKIRSIRKTRVTSQLYVRKVCPEFFGLLPGNFSCHFPFIRSCQPACLPVVPCLLAWRVDWPASVAAAAKSRDLIWKREEKPSSKLIPESDPRRRRPLDPAGDDHHDLLWSVQFSCCRSFLLCTWLDVREFKKPNWKIRAVIVLLYYGDFGMCFCFCYENMSI